MQTEDEQSGLVGHRMPGGRARIEPYVDWLVRDVVGAPQRASGDDTVHPAVAFLVAQGNVGLELEEVFALFGASSQDGPLLGEWTVDFARVLRTGVDYDVSCQVERVVRKRGARTGVFDLATVEIGLDAPDGARHATVRPTYVFPRREGS
ncbi:MAG: hypothetical protein L0I76_04530 [Pseudonocardia sp.]|nr:hypothetical protein [Pseudonocardia sp.]